MNHRPTIHRLRFLLPCLGLTAALSFLYACGATRAGYESPEFKLMNTQEQVEIRNYPGMTVARTRMAAGEDRGDGFRRLFRYISGGNTGEQKIAMTTPVFVEAKDGVEDAMQFVVPDAVAEAGAPAPTGEAVELEQIASGTFGVLRFKGSKDPKARAEALASLRSTLEAMGYLTTGEAIYAYYDPPWTPEALRRNEVMLRIR